METLYQSPIFNYYSANLAEHLRGWDETAGDYTKTDLFSQFGAIALIMAIAVSVLYYYVWNHPRWNRSWVWFVSVVVFGLVNFFMAFGKTYSDLNMENISSDLMPVDIWDCLGFGLSNFAVFYFFYTLCALVFKWGSRNSKYSPFVKF